MEIFYCVDKKGRIVSDPYWEKQDVVMHMEEILFPLSWKKLYDKGYRIKNKELKV